MYALILPPATKKPHTTSHSHSNTLWEICYPACLLCCSLTNRLHAYLIRSSVIRGDCINPSVLWNSPKIDKQSTHFHLPRYQNKHLYRGCQLLRKPIWPTSDPDVLICTSPGSGSAHSPWTSLFFIFFVLFLAPRSVRETKNVHMYPAGRRIVCVAALRIVLRSFRLLEPTKGLTQGCTAALTFTKSCYTWLREVCPRCLHGILSTSLHGLAY